MNLNNPSYKQDLVIVQNWYNYIKYSTKVLGLIPNKIKYNVTDWVIKINLNVIGLLMDVKYSQFSNKKIEKLHEILIEIEKIKFMYNFLYEEKYISLNQFNTISDFLLNTSKMGNGWIKYVTKK